MDGAGSTVKQGHIGLINIRKKEERRNVGGTRWDVEELPNIDFYAKCVAQLSYECLMNSCETVTWVKQWKENDA